MLSILIPCFNQDCSRLVNDLHEQCLACHINFEILVCDDFSTDIDVSNTINNLNSLSYCTVFRSEKNLGRAAVRNILAKKSQYNFLLFIDSDAIMYYRNNHFISNYLKASETADVICGGLSVPPDGPKKGYELRYFYEKNTGKNNFSTFSFLIKRQLFMNIMFDEQISAYGYEDVMLGIKLRQADIDILFIDNPLVHTGIEKSSEYLDKTRKAIDNLFRMKDKFGIETLLLRHYDRVSRMHLTWCLNIIWKLLSEKMELNLTGQHPSLFLFRLYKITFLANLSHK